jgi:phosphate transport system substrate-binding protein
MAARLRPYLAWPFRGSARLRLAVLLAVLVAFILAVLLAIKLTQPTSIAPGYPRVDGSTSTHPLQVLVACRRLGVSCSWQDPTDPGALRQIQPVTSTRESSGAGQQVLSLQHTGTHQSYVRLIANETDLILVARPPSEDELQAAQRAGVTLDVRPVALDAFIFLANVENPIESLDVELVRNVYQGKLTDWAQLGGAEGTIKALRRDRNSGSQELMESLVMRGAVTIEEPAVVEVVETMHGLIDRVARDGRALGYIVYYYAVNMLIDENVKIVGVGGVRPTSETIGEGTYPLVAEVYVVLRADTPGDSPTVTLRDWMLSAEGQTVVAESGYIPLPKTR